ncbi:MAG: glycosyltransferase [Candidatus Aenigmatarchaeota archaeon]
MKEKFSIMIPVYNEEKIIVKNTKKLIKFLDTLHKPYEILICDNGSTDKTKNLGKKLELQFPNKVKFLTIPESKSVGFAFKKMVTVASSDKLISLDMDLTLDFENFILKCLKLLDDNSMVIGSKIDTQKRPLIRKMLSIIGIFLIKILLGLEFSDYSIGAKGYRKRYLMDKLEVIDRSTFYVIKLIFFFKQEGLKIVEIPVKVYDVRKSRFNFFKDAVYRFMNLLNFWFRERIIKAINNTPR